MPRLESNNKETLNEEFLVKGWYYCKNSSPLEREFGRMCQAVRLVFNNPETEDDPTIIDSECKNLTDAIVEVEKTGEYSVRFTVQGYVETGVVERELKKIFHGYKWNGESLGVGIENLQANWNFDTKSTTISYKLQYSSTEEGEYEYATSYDPIGRHQLDFEFYTFESESTFNDYQEVALGGWGKAVSVAPVDKKKLDHDQAVYSAWMRALT